MALSWANLEPIQTHAKTWASAGTLYVALLGFVNDSAYWHSFHVNVLSYIGFDDAVRVGAVALFLYALLIALVCGSTIVLPRIGLTMWRSRTIVIAAIVSGLLGTTLNL
jgi:hypothetical protein